MAMQIKVVSLNVWQGGRLLPEIVEFLKSEQADIVLIQEAYESDFTHEDRFKTVSVLKEKLGFQHADFAQAFMQDDPIGLIPQGNAVLTNFAINKRAKYELSESTRDSYPDEPEFWAIEPRILQHVELESPVGSLNVFNVHGVWDLDGDNFSKQRQRMRDVMLEATRGLPRVILGGDSNAKTTNRANQELEPQLKSVFGTELVTTFNMRQKTNPGYATAAVDIMFVDPGMQVVSRSCPDVNLSDHLPLVAVLELG